MLTTDAYTLGRERLVAGARTILTAERWCSLEVCVDRVAQRWELRAIVLRDDRAASRSVCDGPTVTTIGFMPSRTSMGRI